MVDGKSSTHQYRFDCMALFLGLPGSRSGDIAAVELVLALGTLFARVVAETRMPAVYCIDS